MSNDFHDPCSSAKIRGLKFPACTKHVELTTTLGASKFGSPWNDFSKRHVSSHQSLLFETEKDGRQLQ
jgi:hypothetical protein